MASVGATQAVAIARRELAANSFDGWKVRIAHPFDARRPCASVGFDDAAQVVLLVPTPRVNQATPNQRPAFAGLDAPIGGARTEPIDTTTLALLNGDGRAAAYGMSSGDGRARCIGVLGLHRPTVACTARHGISWWVLRLVDGTLLLTGAGAPSSGIVVHFANGTTTPLTVEAHGYLVGELPQHRTGENAALISRDATDKPITTTPINLSPEPSTDC